jgi:hypothetical protein
MAFPLLWVVGLLEIYVATADRPVAAGTGPNAYAVLTAMVVSVVITLAAHPLPARD